MEYNKFIALLFKDRSENLTIQNAMVRLISAHVPKAPPETTLLVDFEFDYRILAKVAYDCQIAFIESRDTSRLRERGQWEYIFVTYTFREWTFEGLKEQDYKRIKKLIVIDHFDNLNIEERFRKEYPHIELVLLKNALM